MSQLAREIGQQGAVLRTVLAHEAATLVAARSCLARAERRFLVGIGSSRHVAAYGAVCAQSLGPGPALLLDAPGSGVSAPPFRDGDVLVAVSQSGSTPALLTLVAHARARGCTVIAVINAEGSALAGQSDVALHTGAGAELVVPATKSVTASMLLLRALMAPVDAAAVARLADAVDHATQASTRTTTLPDVVVAGGFAAEAVSDEVALKLAEVAAHLAVAETLVDYLHGPVAVAAPVLAFLDDDDPNNALVEGRPDVLVVGTGVQCAVSLHSCGDATLEPIVRVVAGQALALRWAELHGLDPDDARGLRKVTLTA